MWRGMCFLSLSAFLLSGMLPIPVSAAVEPTRIAYVCEASEGGTGEVKCTPTIGRFGLARLNATPDAEALTEVQLRTRGMRRVADRACAAERRALRLRDPFGRGSIALGSTVSQLVDVRGIARYRCRAARLVEGSLSNVSIEIEAPAGTGPIGVDRVAGLTKLCEPVSDAAETASSAGTMPLSCYGADAHLAQATTRRSPLRTASQATTVCVPALVAACDRVGVAVTTAYAGAAAGFAVFLDYDPSVVALPGSDPGPFGSDRLAILEDLDLSLSFDDDLASELRFSGLRILDPVPAGDIALVDFDCTGDRVPVAEDFACILDAANEIGNVIPGSCRAFVTPAETPPPPPSGPPLVESCAGITVAIPEEIASLLPVDTATGFEAFVALSFPGRFGIPEDALSRVELQGSAVDTIEASIEREADRGRLFLEMVSARPLEDGLRVAVVLDCFDAASLLDPSEARCGIEVRNGAGELVYTKHGACESTALSADG